VFLSGDGFVWEEFDRYWCAIYMIARYEAGEGQGVEEAGCWLTSTLFDLCQVLEDWGSLFLEAQHPTAIAKMAHAE